MNGLKGLKGGNEFDCLTRWRKRLQPKPAHIRAAKRSFWKRKRKEAKKQARREASSPES